MTIQPRDVDGIYTSLRDKLINKTAKLTNFAETGFNYVWTRAWSRDIQEQEEKILAALLAGFPDYAGKELTEEDLDDLGVDYDPDKINEYMKDQHLDELGKLVGVTRDQGQKATGKVTFETTSDDTRIYEGVSVGTTPDADGEFLEFLVDADGDGKIEPNSNEYVTPSQGNTTVEVDIIAAEVGDEYNVGAGQIVYMPNPPVGVLGVSNNASTTGGKDVQTNSSLRSEIKDSVTSTSGGGTTAGIEGYVAENVTGVSDDGVIVNEFPDATPPYANVVVDGGSDSDVQTAIDESRPAAVRHNLVRPAIYQIDVLADLEGTDIDTARVKTEIEDYLLNLGLGERLVGDRIVQIILNAEDDVTNIDYTELLVPQVTHEDHKYNGSNTYKFNYIYRDGGLAREIKDEQGNTYTKTVDYGETDISGDGILDGIDWSVGGGTPSSGDEFFVDYYAEEDFTFESGTTKYTTQGSPTGNTVVVDRQGNEFSSTAYQFNDTDSDGLNDEIEWTDTSVIDDGQEFYVKYGEAQEVDFVYDEVHTYSTGQSVYTLNNDLVPSDRDDTIRDAASNTYTEGTDFEYIDDDGDGEIDSVDWSIGGGAPSDSTDFYVSYKTEDDISFTTRQKADPATVTVNVV